MAIGYFAYYLIWRWLFTLNPDQIILSLLLFFAEAFGVFNFMVFVWMTWDIRPSKQTSKPFSNEKADIFITTYNEDEDLLEATLSGCSGVNRRGEIYLLDDGNRQAIQSLAKKYGCIYVARKNNVHAKAGNINNALSKSKADFILFLDADTVPQPEVIEKTIGFMQDKDLALVQTPQEFYNKRASIQHDRKKIFWHEQSLFFRVIQPGKNYSESAFWTGTPSLVRKSALEEIGGIATDTVTEDLHTSVRLHAAGFKTYFHNETLAFGVAPQTIHSFLVQRLRWAQGTMQLYRSKESPLWIRGLTLKQRVSYFASFLAYIQSLQKLILVVFPSVVLVSQALPMKVGAFDFVLRWMPYLILTVLMNSYYGRGYFNFLETEKYNILKMPTFLSSLRYLISTRTLSFKVTPKKVGTDVWASELVSLRGYFALLGVILGLSLSGFVRMAIDPDPFFDKFVIAFVSVWGFYNIVQIFAGIRFVFSQKHFRQLTRYKLDFPGYLHDKDRTFVIPVHIRDISFSGAKLVLHEPELPNTDSLVLSFRIEDQPEFEIEIKPIGGQESKSTRAVRFGNLSDVASLRLRNLIYVYLPMYVYSKSRIHWQVSF